MSDPLATAASLSPLLLALSTALACILRWVVKREIARLEDLLGTRLTPGNAAALDAAIDQAAAAIAPVLAGFADEALKARLAPLMASAEAQAILRYLPQASAALGLGPDQLAQRIAAALGDPLAPARS